MSLSGWRILAGRLFQSRDPAAAKFRSPSRLLVRGTRCIVNIDDRRISNHLNLVVGGCLSTFILSRIFLPTSTSSRNIVLVILVMYRRTNRLNVDVYSWVSGDLGWFCHWLSCRDQSVLLILDNLEVDRRRDIHVSAMLDQLVAGCSRLKLLITSRRLFYRGRFSSGHVTYKVPDMRHSADQLFLQVGICDTSVHTRITECLVCL